MKNFNPNIIIIFLIAITVIIANVSCKKSGYVSPEEGYYTCSMDPQVIQQEPGDCPICGMKLTFQPAAKKKKHADHSKNNQSKNGKDKSKGEFLGTQSKNFTFSLASNLLQNAKVYTVPAKKEKFTRENTYSGHIDYDESPNRLVIINTKYAGWIEKLYVSKEGQWVKRGSLLMGVYSQKILASKEEYITTYQSLKKLYESQGKSVEEFRKDRTLIASKRKLQYLDVPSAQINRMETTGVADKLTYYHSPISGVIIKKNVLKGSHIKPGMELFRVANLSRLWIFIHIFEKDLPFVKKGQQVEIQSTVYPDKKFKGKIDLIYPFFNMKTRDIKVRIIISNRKGILKPGMFVNVNVKSNITKNVVTIPDHSVIFSGEKNYVFVSLGDGDFEVRPVIVLTRSAGKAVISSGLKKNDMIVANGQFLLDSEASLKEALQKGKMTEHQH